MTDEKVTPINQIELYRRIKGARPQNADSREGFALVNVLSQDEFASGHIPASINIPKGNEEEFERRFAKDKEIIVYCASSECDASSRVARRLADMGFSNIYDYEAGMRDWKKSHGVVETGFVDQ